MKNESFFQLETLLEPVFIASNYMADDGRPLAELTAVSQLKQGVEFEMRRCPYSGSRFNKEMNVSALPGLSQQIKYVISDTIDLRTEYLKYINQSQFSLGSFWFFTRTLDSLPAYLVRRYTHPIDKSCLPARVSAMFKAAQGLHLAPEVMLLNGESPESPISIDGLVDFIEDKELFMDDGRACAGPPAMIRAFVASAVDGDGRRVDNTELIDLLGDQGIEGLFKYSDAVTRVFATKVLFEAHCRYAVKNIIDQLDNDLLRSKSDVTLQRFGSLRKRSFEIRERVKTQLQKFGYVPNFQGQTRSPKDPKRLEKMITLRNPHLSSFTIKLAVQLLLSSIHETEAWVGSFSHGQQKVLNALGHLDFKVEFHERDFRGLGYLPEEVLGDWLSIEVLPVADGFTVKAGASIDHFEWS